MLVIVGIGEACTNDYIGTIMLGTVTGSNPLRANAGILFIFLRTDSTQYKLEILCNAIFSCIIGDSVYGLVWTPAPLPLCHGLETARPTAPARGPGAARR